MTVALSRAALAAAFSSLASFSFATPAGVSSPDVTARPVVVNAAATTVGASLARLDPILRGGVLQALGDSKVTQAMAYSPTVGSVGAGATKGLNNPATWIEAALRGVRFDMTIAPPGFQGRIVGLKQLRDFRGTGCSYATATVSGATGFAAAATISGGQIVGWTVTSAHMSGTALTTYAAVTITSDCAGAVYATPVVGGQGVFGASGQSLREIRERAADVCAGTFGAKPNIVVIAGGDNDLALTGGLASWSGSTPLVTPKILALRMMDVVNDLAACGILPVVLAHPPRSQSGFTGAGYSSAQATAAKKVLNGFNAAMRLARDGNAALNPAGTHFLFVDGYVGWYADNSSNNGDPINYLTVDGTHWNQWGAALAGYFAARELLPFVRGVGFSTAVVASDAYDAAINPTGNLLAVPNGTAGTASGVMTGSLWSGGWVNDNFGGTAPAAGSITVAASVPTSAARNAAGLVTPTWTETFAAAAVTGSGSANRVTARHRTGAKAIASGVAVGDYLEGACDVQYSGLRNVGVLYLSLLDSGTGLSYFGAGNNGNYMPMATDPIVGAAGPTGWFGWPLRFRTPPLLVQAATLATNTMDFQIGALIDVSETPGSTAIGASAGVAGTVTWSNCAITQYRPSLM